MASGATGKNQAASWTRFVPILSWAPHYDRAWFPADIIAGLTLWGLVVPEAMAYAGLAGLPPQVGLYTLAAALLVYAIFGSSRHLTVQATSATAALMASTLAVYGATVADPQAYMMYATGLVLVVAVVFLVAGVLRLGFVTQFLSKPVMDGFITGLAIFIAVGQLNKLFGVPKGEGNTVEKLLAVIRELPNANWVTFAVGAAALALLFLLPRLNKRIPAGLVVLFGSILISAVLDLEGRYGVEVVGVLPAGLPTLSFPNVSTIPLIELVLPAIGILLVSYSESLGVAREFADKHHYEVDPDQELRALGFVNMASGMVGGQLAAGSMSASAVKETAGGRSQMANLVTWVAALITLLFLTPLFADLPEAVLAALIIHAVWHIIAERKLQKVRLYSRAEFWLGVLALAGVLLIDVLEGMIIGLVASLLLVIYQSSRPHVAVLGRAPGLPGAFGSLDRHMDYTSVPGVLIVRMDAPLYYANALTVRDRVRALVADSDPPAHAVVFDFAAQDDLDYTTAEMLAELVKELREKSIRVVAADVHAPVQAAAGRFGMALDSTVVYPSVDAALRALDEAM
ncbi:MAG: sulfate permease [Anaerolineae bacterium]